FSEWPVCTISTRLSLRSEFGSRKRCTVMDSAEKPLQRLSLLLRETLVSEPLCIPWSNKTCKVGTWQNVSAELLSGDVRSERQTVSNFPKSSIAFRPPVEAGVHHRWQAAS